MEYKYNLNAINPKRLSMASLIYMNRKRANITRRLLITVHPMINSEKNMKRYK